MKKIGARKLHKYLGLFISIFILLFAVSGIILNHRYLFRNIDINRKYLPQTYRFNNWNNSAVRGNYIINDKESIIYGSAGMFLWQDSTNEVKDFNNGLPQSAENRYIWAIAKTSNNNLFATSSFYTYKYDGEKWHDANISGISGRITDMTSKGDSLVIVTRSNLYLVLPPYKTAQKITVPPKKGREHYRMSLLRFVWSLHTGELFGILGKIAVDILGVLFIILAITGIIYTIMPFSIRRARKQNRPVKNKQNIMSKSINWHNKIGVPLFWLFILLTVTGGFLRPPLILALIRGEVPAIPFSHFDTNNMWYDKLRMIRYDYTKNDWLLYTSDGLVKLQTLNSVPKDVENTPTISVMGTNFIKQIDGRWLIGSFEGLYMWDRNNSNNINCFTGKQAEKKKKIGPPSFDHMITGVIISSDEKTIYPVEYDHGLININQKDIGGTNISGSTSKIKMPEDLKNSGRMSIWRASLEAHTGRILSPIIGKVTMLYIFITSIIIVIILYTGLRVYKRRYKKNKK